MSSTTINKDTVPGYLLRTAELLKKAYANGIRRMLDNPNKKFSLPDEKYLKAFLRAAEACNSRGETPEEYIDLAIKASTYTGILPVNHLGTSSLHTKMDALKDNRTWVIVRKKPDGEIEQVKVSYDEYLFAVQLHTAERTLKMYVADPDTLDLYRDVLLYPGYNLNPVAVYLLTKNLPGAPLGDLLYAAWEHLKENPKLARAITTMGYSAELAEIQNYGDIQEQTEYDD